jgi:hypothetical protein
MQFCGEEIEGFLLALVFHQSNCPSRHLGHVHGSPAGFFNRAITSKAL